MRVLLIDNDDSFTWNLWHLIRSLGAQCIVKRNDAITLQDIRNMKPDRIVLSPGPGGPKGAKVSLDILRGLSGHIPILGVCLGHQCMGYVFGNSKNVVPAREVKHGKTSAIHHSGKSIFKGVPSPFKAARYHSLIVKKVPKNFEAIAFTAPSPPSPLPPHFAKASRGKSGEGWRSRGEGEILMAMKHKNLPLFGLQFHPESFLTEHGKNIMSNFLFKRW